MKKTKWFPAGLDPVRVGVYRVVKSYGEAWAYWDGRAWSHGTVRDMAPSATVFTRNSSAFPVERWRGLTEGAE